LQANARRQDVRLVTDYPEQPLWAKVDHDQLRAVLVNLLLNAMEAMPRGGHLNVALTATFVATGGSPVVASRQKPTGEPPVATTSPAVELTVTDTGSGIPADILKRLFTPFVSGKPTGTGLGLCISRRIVENHGGRITARNRAEGGAVVAITLPVVERN
ncbi:MAG: sensor histidine kinase, partial [Gemmataceae bacterium]